MPSRPPSPPGTTSATVFAGVTVRPSDLPPGPTLRIRLVSRSVTSAPPSGRYAMPHGTLSPFATTVATTPISPLGLGFTDGVGSFGGEPAESGGGGPKLHPATSSRPAVTLATA